MIGHPIKGLTMACLCVLVAACGAGGGSGKIASASKVQASPGGEVDAIVVLLERGDAKGAKKKLKAGLKRAPLNPSLMLLDDSIGKNPQELLGTESYRYTVRPGDTMASLSQRFLGNRLKFYELSRYNGIDNPSSLAVGQIINIPGRPAPVVQPRPATAPRAAAPKPALVPKPAAPKPAAPARAASPAAAQQARSAGLAALNAGQPRQAVSLLSRAASLDPGNPAIARDLARARRIAATVGK